MDQERVNALLSSNARKRRIDMNELLGREFLKIGNSLLSRKQIGNGSQVPDGDDSEPEPIQKPNIMYRLIMRETRIAALVYALLGTILFWSFGAFVLLNVNFVNGYPSMRLPPSPGPFQSGRYWPNYIWGIFYLLWYNFAPPIALVLVVVLPRSRSVLVLHWWINLALTCSNIVAFFSLLGYMWGFCNTGWSWGSPCNSAITCCINGDSSSAVGWCPVTPAGCTPSASFTQLTAWQPYYLTFLYTVFFFLYDFFGFAFNSLL